MDLPQARASAWALRRSAVAEPSPFCLPPSLATSRTTSHFQTIQSCPTRPAYFNNGQKVRFSAFLIDSYTHLGP